MPYRQMPVLEIDGVKYCQSHSIARYLAKEFDLAGKTSLENLKADEFAEAAYEVMLKYPWTEKDEEKKVRGGEKVSLSQVDALGQKNLR